MAKIQDKTFNRIIEGKLLELSDEEISSLGLTKATSVVDIVKDDIDESSAGQLYSPLCSLINEAIGDGHIETGIKIKQIGSPAQLVVDGESDPMTAQVSFVLTEEQANTVKSSKLVIFTMNNSFVLTPLAQLGDTLACQSFAYNSVGDTMVVRLRFNWNTNTLVVSFDSSFASAVYASGITPYALLLVAN